MRQSAADGGRPQMTIWQMDIASWIAKSTNTHTHTHRLCNTHCFLTAGMIAQTRLNATLYVLCLSYSLLIALSPHQLKTSHRLTVSWHFKSPIPRQ